MDGPSSARGDGATGRAVGAALLLAILVFIAGWVGASQFFVGGWPTVFWPLVYLLPQVPAQWSAPTTLWGALALSGLMVVTFGAGWKLKSGNFRATLLLSAACLVAGEVYGGYWRLSSAFGYLLNASSPAFGDGSATFAASDVAIDLTAIATSALLIVSALALGRIASDIHSEQRRGSRIQLSISNRSLALAVLGGFTGGVMGSASDYGYFFVFNGLHLSSGDEYFTAISFFVLVGLVLGPVLLVAGSYWAGRRVLEALDYLLVLFCTTVGAFWGFLLGFLAFAAAIAAENVPVTSSVLLSVVSHFGGLSGNSPAAMSYAVWLSLVAFGALALPWIWKRPAAPGPDVKDQVAPG